MRNMLIAAALALAASVSCAQPHRLILVGDSTMATKSGYGDALCARFDGPCLNLARGGRSSMSFRAEGRWDELLKLLAEPGAPRSYVLIQFGHNDQPGKPGRSTDLVHDFPANLARYVDEARAAGATPVLLTPLTRRSFRGPWLHDDLAPWAATTRRIAAEKGALLLDLHRLSSAAVQAMGEARADQLAMAPKPQPGQPIHPATTAERAGAANPVFDRTHLGDPGARLFSSMVARELQRLAPELGPRLQP
jgi:lysophospholipase L1-like esterase